VSLGSGSGDHDMSGVNKEKTLDEMNIESPEILQNDVDDDGDAVFVDDSIGDEDRGDQV